MSEQKSIYRRAAAWGIPFGLYLSVAAVAFIYGDHLPVLNIFVMLMALMAPVLVYRYQRQTLREEDGLTSHAALWMMGILIYMFGALVASLVAYALIVFVRPDFMYEHLEHFLSVYESTPATASTEMAQTMRDMLDKGLVPQSIDMVLSMFWFVSFFGSVLSAFTAWLARRMFVRNTFKN